jgi:hypothetical protein
LVVIKKIQNPHRSSQHALGGIKTTIKESQWKTFDMKTTIEESQWKTTGTISTRDRPRLNGAGWLKADKLNPGVNLKFKANFPTTCL